MNDLIVLNIKAHPLVFGKLPIFKNPLKSPDLVLSILAFTLSSSCSCEKIPCPRSQLFFVLIEDSHLAFFQMYNLA